VILRCDGDDESCLYYSGLFLWLERQGVAVRTDGPPGIVTSGGEHRAQRRGPARAILHVSINKKLDGRLTQPDQRLVAYWGSPSSGQRAEVVRRVAALDDLRRERRIDNIGYFARRVRLVKELGPFAIGVFALATTPATTRR
jgi:hypothetical protein